MRKLSSWMRRRFSSAAGNPAERRLRRGLCSAVLGLSVFVLPAKAGPIEAAPAAPTVALELDSRPLPLVDTLRDAVAWNAYKQRFVTARGRVVDTANGMVSHSEGQGYGMLLAVAAGDRATFDRIWGWTRANLMVRNDELIAWRWEPGKRPAVADMNDASDGDILVAWALVEAAQAWPDIAYQIAARRIAVEIGRKLIVNRTNWGPLLLPAVSGFAAEDRADGPVVNLSYWVFPAFARLPLAAPEFNWSGLRQSGLDLVKIAHFGPARLTSDWISARGEQLRPAESFKPVFGYNAIRIPLYLAWAGVGNRDHYAPFVDLWSGRTGSGLPVVDVTTGRATERLVEPGFTAIAKLTACAVGVPIPGMANGKETATSENYYPASLHLLAIVAAHMRYPRCVAN